MLNTIVILMSMAVSRFIIYGTPNGFTVVETRSPTVVLADGHSYITNCDVLQVKPEDALKLIVANWTKPVTMNEFCVLSRHWTQKIVSEPNVVEPNIPEPNIPEPNTPEPIDYPMVWLRDGDAFYHLTWCPIKPMYAKEIPLPIVSIENNLPCTICNPPMYIVDEQ